MSFRKDSSGCPRCVGIDTRTDSKQSATHRACSSEVLCGAYTISISRYSSSSTSEFFFFAAAAAAATGLAMIQKSVESPMVPSPEKVASTSPKRSERPGDSQFWYTMTDPNLVQEGQSVHCFTMERKPTCWCGMPEVAWSCSCSINEPNVNADVIPTSPSPGTTGGRVARTGSKFRQGPGTWRAWGKDPLLRLALAAPKTRLRDPVATNRAAAQAAWSTLKGRPWGVSRFRVCVRKATRLVRFAPRTGSVGGESVVMDELLRSWRQ